jgi:HSP20 family protein
MAITPKDSLDWLILFRQQINEIFSFLSNIDREDANSECNFTPFVDIFETADKFVVEIDLPGMDQQDLSVSICCNTLIIEGLKRNEVKNPKSAYICLERRFGRFCRTVEIPPTIDQQGIKALYALGVLSVIFPRKMGKTTIIRNIPIEQS